MTVIDIVMDIVMVAAMVICMYLGIATGYKYASHKSKSKK